MSAASFSDSSLAAGVCSRVFLVLYTFRQRRWLPAARELGIALLLPLAIVGLWHVLPGAASSAPRGWDDGAIRYYDASGMNRTVTTAAARWNASGAQVRLKAVDSAEAADVVITTDDRRLRAACGADCLGFTTSIGRPADGAVSILLAQELSGNPRPLSIWVAAHEFGHVLGLEHHDGRACSLMSPHAFDTRCAPSPAADPPTLEALACVPAPGDVEDAAEIYGGEPRSRDPRCR